MNAAQMYKRAYLLSHDGERKADEVEGTVEVNLDDLVEVLQRVHGAGAGQHAARG